MESGVQLQTSKTTQNNLKALTKPSHMPEAQSNKPFLMPQPIM